MDTVQNESAFRSILEKKAKELPVLTRTTNGNVRYCEKCKCIKPDRAHHCSVCQTCVLKMVNPVVIHCFSSSSVFFFILSLKYKGSSLSMGEQLCGLLELQILHALSCLHSSLLRLCNVHLNGVFCQVLERNSVVSCRQISHILLVLRGCHVRHQCMLTFNLSHLFDEQELHNSW